MGTINYNTRLIDLTLGDLLDAIGKTPTVTMDNKPKEKRIEYGIGGIARLFNCSMTTANRIKASGKINKAISQCGRLIVVDADLALELMK
jgi:hypothetical protein